MAEAPVPFGRYRLLSLLGAGGMARVYRAVLPGPMGFEKEVAVKRIDLQLTEDGQFVQALVNEARLGGELRHRNLVEIYEFDQVGGHYYLSMQYVDGWTLQQVLRLCREIEQPMPVSVAVAVVISICEGLHYAHSAVSRSGQPLNLVHRDLKPANIMISRAGEVLVMDFGIAKADTNAFHNTSVGVSKGTPLYMSPEQVRGEPLDRRSDLFSLGSVLFEMVSSEPCFRGEDLVSILHHITVSQPQSVIDRMPSEARILEPIITGCMAGEPEGRFQSARQLRLALVQLQRDLPAAPSLADWLDDVLPGLPLQRSVGDFGRGSRPVAVTLPGSSKFLATDETIVGDLSPARSDSESIATVRVAPGTNLRPPLDSFVGREGELEQIAAALVQGSGRLVTLLGAGGTGKTRLATHFGLRYQEDFPGGIWFCDLTESVTLEGLVSSVGQSLGLELVGKEPTQQLAHAIAGRGRVLLVLDNFEQLVDHAVGSIGLWLSVAPQACFLVTSRRRLNIESEQIVGLGPLPLDEAVQLFEDRARMVQAGFTIDDNNRSLIGEIVTRLDCLSLAIELAAARLRILPPARLLERLSARFDLLRAGRRDQSGRQLTLRGAIDWSWNLLEPWEQAALAQCSVFRGGFTLESAEEVLDTAAWEQSPWVMDNVEALVDHSLVRVDEAQPGCLRFSLYESIREFAAEKMADEGAVVSPVFERQTGAEALEELRRRHARHYSKLGAREHLDSLNLHGGVEHWLSLRLETENLLGGMDASVAGGWPAEGAACVLAIMEVFCLTGPCNDGILFADRILGLPGVAEQERGRLLLGKGDLLRSVGRMDEAIEALTDARDIAARTQDAATHGVALDRLALIHGTLGDHDLSLQLFEEALALLQQVGDRRREGSLYGSLGLNCLARGDLARAREHYASALAIHREVGNRRSEGVALGNLALVFSEAGHYREAEESLLQALGFHREVGNRRFEGIALGNLGGICRQEQRWDEASGYWNAALMIHREVGNRRFEGMMLGFLGDLSWTQGELSKSQEYLVQAVEICDEVFPSGAGFFRASLAIIEAHFGNFDEARRLLALGDKALRGVYRSSLALLLCKRAEVEHLAGELVAAHASYLEAGEIHNDLSASAASELGRYLARLESLLGVPGVPDSDMEL